MASGPELMMNALLKAMGFDPRQFIAQIQGFITEVNKKLLMFTASAQSIDNRIEEQQRQISSLHSKLDLLLALQQGKVIEHEPITGGYVNGSGPLHIGTGTAGAGDAFTIGADPDPRGGDNEPA